MTPYELKNLAEKLSQQEILDIAKYWTEYQEKWNEARVGQFFMVDGSFGDLFLHKVIQVFPNERYIIAQDFSLPNNPVVQINYLPELFNSANLAREYYSKKYPSVF